VDFAILGDFFKTSLKTSERNVTVVTNLAKTIKFPSRNIIPGDNDFGDGMIPDNVLQ
jgi:hypothetical protein